MDTDSKKKVLTKEKGSGESVEKKGVLHLFIGPMFSGKTTKLIEIANKFSEKSRLCINHEINHRDGNSFKSHDGKIMLDVVTENSLLNVCNYPKYKASGVIFIDELQFFKDAYDGLFQMIEKDGKDVFCAGLDGTYKREPFGDVLKLIPFADTVTKFQAKCSVCESHASFTQKIIGDGGVSGSGSGGDVEVGGSDIYKPVCRKHFSIL